MILFELCNEIAIPSEIKFSNPIINYCIFDIQNKLKNIVLLI